MNMLTIRHTIHSTDEHTYIHTYYTHTHSETGFITLSTQSPNSTQFRSFRRLYFYRSDHPTNSVKAELCWRNTT